MEKRCGSTARQSFDSAYANLELTVRNFSRDKLMYEDNIKGLHRKIDSLERTIRDNNLAIQSLLTENQKLETIHEEDQTDRYTVEAMLASVTMKQDLISKTVGELEMVEKETFERYDAIGDFIDSLRSRQVQLYDWIGELNQTIQNEKLLVRESEKQLMETVTNYERNIQELQIRYDQEKMIFEDRIRKLAGKLDEFTFQNETLVQEVKDTANKLSESNQQLSDAKIQCEKDGQEKMILEDRIQKLTVNVNELTLQNETLVQEVKDTANKLSESNQQLSDAKTQCEKDGQEKMILEDRIQKLTVNVNELTLQNETLVQEVKDTAHKLSESNQQLSDAKIQCEKDGQEKMILEDRIQKLTVNVNELTLQNETLVQEIKDTANKLSESNQQLSDAKTQCEKDGQEKMILEDRIQKLTVNVNELTLQNETLVQEVKDTANKLSESNQQLSDTKIQYEKAQTSLEAKANEDKAEFESKIAKLKDEIESSSYQKANLGQLLEETREMMSETENRTAAELNEKSMEIVEKEKRIDSMVLEIQRLNNKIRQTDNEILEKAALHEQSLQQVQSRNMLEVRQLIVKNENLTMENKKKTSENDALSTELAKTRQKLIEMRRRANAGAGDAMLSNDLENQSLLSTSEKKTSYESTTSFQKKADKEKDSRKQGGARVTGSVTGVKQPLKLTEDKIDEQQAEKMQPRRSSFQIPSSMRTPTTPRSCKSILKSEKSLEKDPKNVSFNKTVEVRKYPVEAITLSSSDSSSESDAENLTFNSGTADPPKKRQKLSPTETGKEISVKGIDSISSNTSISDKESNVEPIEPKSPKKFFKTRTSPLKTYNSCKSPSRLQKSSS